jgi:isoleucyl-tRNA synthetase
MESKKSEVAMREEHVLAFWNDNHIFEKTLQKDAPQGDFVFYDGPPFATGTPHYGHLLQSAIKDAIPRYKTMRGYRVQRQWGWDCHGLPIENIVEKEIGTKSKKDIMAMGVKAFNDKCREQIFTFIHEWERIIPRFGRWADMEHPYRTMDFEYMQSEWWAFKTLHEKGYVYEDYRSMHICPRCETTLSQGEVAEGYKEVKDLSAMVKFKVKNPEKHGLPENTHFLAWTTTPWTLPGNVALAVAADKEYVVIAIPKGKISQEGDRTVFENILATENLIVLKERVQAYPTLLSEYNPETVRSISGESLVGIEYEPLFDYYQKNESLKSRENGWKVYAADFVTTDTGTGIVHIAPAFGADDMALGKQENLPFVQHVKMDGTFAPETGEFAGLDLKPRAKDKPEEIREADLTIVRALGDKVFSTEKYSHSYPHCWRCDTALLNYATSSWFVAVEKLKPTLLETAKKIQWAPAHIKEGRFGQWLDGARDWSISRQRFWANTIPVWRCEQCKKYDVFGSAAELEKASGVLVTDLHKDVVDEITVPCACGGTAHRVPDVLDTWFDSGSVPFATKSYGAQQAYAGEKLAPADFIGEAQDQTRAWFYYQHVLAGALFGTEAFKNCVVTGIVLAEDGKKMSKKLKNYPDPVEMIDKYGADAMRVYMLGSPVVRAESLSFSEKEVGELSRKVFGRLANVYEFYALYRATPHVPSTTSTDALDRWILARLSQVQKQATLGLESYALDEAVRPFAQFVDDLSTWYVRRSRDRIKDGDVQALATTAHVLRESATLLAPFAPFFAEWLWREVRSPEDAESVHLCTWNDAHDLAESDHQVLSDMQEVRNVVSLALEQRAKAGIPVRQPLARLGLVSGGREFSPELIELIKDEVNVKEIARIAGLPEGFAVELDTAITPELREEGMVREIIRAIQAARKDAGLQPGQQARAKLSSSEPLLCAAAQKYTTQISATTSLESLAIEQGDTGLSISLL